ncbi:MAG: bifunctional [glutamine synthetase] adenylyltransferase/[glutamine synthetase]-adenylyl-L-tyrosine phosphorylase [Minwuia sp.]|nr:bifunctional [glutamine synthetase] adenylyltransferase/[glutamine synthetase]-adenylyl-L-tyrosine phosphorylase [Minwuia sp.]
MTSFADSIIEKPLVDNADAVARSREKWLSADTPDRGITTTDRQNVVGHPHMGELLNGIFGNSPYLTALVHREADLPVSLLQAPVEALIETEMQQLESCWSGPSSFRQMAGSLRRIKRRIALLIAMADTGGVWTVEQVTQALSDFADGAVRSALRFLLAQAETDGHMTLANAADPAEGSGLFVLAMGKMGAGELNYSSDIDLIVLFDEPAALARSIDAPREFFPRMIRKLVQLMQERTPDGYVFRTDLRLRPDPASSPVALSSEAALLYYENLAQNWERAAMIKARVAAGDLVAGESFMEEIDAFIWRRNLDYAAIADIQSIKRQIHAHKGHDRITVAGHDIKVGRGGIREIEFFAQTQQLIFGGRDPSLRNRRTIEALNLLVAAERLAPDVAEDMTQAYRFLRRIEHRLQMLDDSQTQVLPKTDEGLRRLACFSGFPDENAFAEALTTRLTLVHNHYADLFAEAPSLAADRGNLVFTGTDPDPGTVETLKQMGFQSPEGIIETIKGWHAGRYRATRTSRARQLMNDLVPALLKAVAATANPDAALRRFDSFLKQLPAGIQFMSLLHANPGLLRLLARIMGTAPGLAETLSRKVHLLDCLLEPGDDDLLDPQAALERIAIEQSHAEDHEGELDAVRRFANERKFRIGVDLLEGRIGAHAAGEALSLTADTVLQDLLPRVIRQVAVRHGTVEPAGMAVIAMGKLGGQELAFGSDLDLVFVYDDGQDVHSSDGDAPLSIGPWFTRVSQRYITAISSLTSEGMLYEVDMRLRPSGNSGAVAVPLSAYASYMRQDAWIWELMAATRARVITGPESLTYELKHVLHEVVTREQDVEELRNRVRDMRAKIMAHHGTADIWAVKHVRGGLVDLEFMVQYLILANAHRHPGIVSGNVATALKRLGEHDLLQGSDTAALIQAHADLQGTQSLLRLCFSGKFTEDAASPDFRTLLARLTGAGSFDGVRERLVETQRLIGDVYERIVGRD